MYILIVATSTFKIYEYPIAIPSRWVRFHDLL